jgi:ABC-type sugar transport system ATPase subunit
VFPAIGLTSTIRNGSTEAEALFAVLRRLKAEGKAIVFVSHKLDEVIALSGRVTVLRDRKTVVACEPIAAVSRSRMVSAMIGREEPIHLEYGAIWTPNLSPTLFARTA